jgi:hypothetical protein
MVTHLIAYILSAMGLTILVVWPTAGPSAWGREHILRPLLPGKSKEVLDCYICFSFWAGLIASPLWWHWYKEPWIWLGCLIMPAVFWLALGQGRS